MRSVHVNGWFDDYDKLGSTRRLLAQEFGVANVSEYAERIEQLPAWVTPSASGAGFIELTEALLQARGWT
ncbi:MAG: hypothetical protein AAB319_00685 [Pseudomonadota bacterium]|mgnify:CR=1 FL=1